MTKQFQMNIIKKSVDAITEEYVNMVMNVNMNTPQCVKPDVSLDTVIQEATINRMANSSSRNMSTDKYHECRQGGICNLLHPIELMEMKVCHYYQILKMYIE